MIHITADLDLFDLALLGVLGMIMFSVWIYLICKCVELFNQD